MIDEKKPLLPVVDESAFLESHRRHSKGGPRKMKESVREIVEELGANPVELLVDLVNGNYEALGFEKATSIRTDREGNPIAEYPNLTPEIRYQAAKTLMEYIFSKKFTVGGDAKNPIEFKGKAEVDYQKLAQMIKTARGEE